MVMEQAVSTSITMRTLWVCDVSGAPFKFQVIKPGATSLGLEEGHKDEVTAGYVAAN